MKKSICLLLFTLSWPTFAERWFDVEIIFFRYNTAPKDTGEDWPENASKVDMSNVISFNDVSALKKYQIDPLTKDKLELSEYYNKLSQSKKYKNLTHMGWRQNDSGRNKAPKLGISVGKELANNKSELIGNLHLYVDHYLFLETDLILYQPVLVPYEQKFDPRTNNAQSSTGYETKVQGFNVKQHRRMRSEEIHYIDHPLMGLIVQVRRLDRGG